MNIAQRIQALRKARGLSQEELAEQIGVSRQAVSKWEAEQSQPEPEKIILLSEFFGVSCDYLMKGGEPPKADPLQAAGSPRELIALSTTVSFISLILSCALWRHFQNPLCTAVAFIGFALGLFPFLMDQLRRPAPRQYRAWARYWSVNIWIIALPVISQFQYFPSLSPFYAPYPEIRNSLTALYCLAGYLLVCVTVTCFCCFRMRSQPKTD